MKIKNRHPVPTPVPDGTGVTDPVEAAAKLLADNRAQAMRELSGRLEQLGRDCKARGFLLTTYQEIVGGQPTPARIVIVAQPNG